MKATNGNLRCKAVARTVVVKHLNLSSARERCQTRCENGIEVSNCNRCQLAATDPELDPGGCVRSATGYHRARLRGRTGHGGSGDHQLHNSHRFPLE